MAPSPELVWGKLIIPRWHTNLDGLAPAAIGLCWELSRTTRVIPPECRVDGEEVGTQLNVPHGDGGTIRSCPHLDNLL